MKSVVLVTGNPNKAREYEALLPADAALAFETRALDLAEIQSMDIREIVADKARRAYEAIGKPVMVEDVSAGLESLNGLPGPFIKFFEKRMGKAALRDLSRVPGDVATVTCVAAYFDGERLLFGEGILRGEIVAPRGENGFGFDCVIVPEGETMTMAEMTPEKKNGISHRSKAVLSLVSQLLDLPSA